MGKPRGLTHGQSSDHLAPIVRLPELLQCVVYDLKVEVGVVKIVPRTSFEIELPFKTIDYVVKHTMHVRRKYCKHSVKTMFPPKRTDLVSEVFRKSGVHPKLRSFELESSHFRDLCYAYDEIANRIPQLRKVDTYDDRQWSKRYFDEDGNPKTDMSLETDEKSDDWLFRTEIPTFDGIFESNVVK